MFSLDVWQEIIAFFDGYYADDMGSLYSLATVSQAISNLALNRMWADSDSLNSFYHVLNATKKVLYYTNSGGWRLFCSLNEDICLRVRTYLSRISCLTIRLEDEIEIGREFSLWRILHLCAAPSAPLLPRLVSINIFHIKRDDVERIDITSFIPILSPSLGFLRIVDQNSAIFFDIPGLLHLAKSCGCNFERLDLQTKTCSALIPAVSTSFPSVKKLYISIMDDDIPRIGSLSIADTLERLSSLVCLRLDLRVLRSLRPTCVITHGNIEELRLDGNPQDLSNFFRTARLPLLQTLMVSIHSPRFIRWLSLFDNAARCCPTTKDFLHFEVKDRNATKLCFQDLAPIASLSPRHVILQDIPSTLSTKEVSMFLRKLPSLVSAILPSVNLEIGNWSDDTKSLLINVAEHPSLEVLTVDLDFRSLLTPKMRKKTAESKSTLHTLKIRAGRYFPVKTSEMYILARNLRELFPSLKFIEYIGNFRALKVQIADFQDLIATMPQDMSP